MTILPKKKQSKDKNEASTSDHSGPSGVETRHDSRGSSRRPPSPPPRWGSPTPREDPRLGASHDPGGLYDEFSPMEGASGHNKRRHRSSPHRNVRKHRGWDPIPHPSTSSHNQTHRHSNYRHDRPTTSQDLNLSPAMNLSPTMNNDNLAVEALEELNGYNSGDEYSEPPPCPENIEQLEQWFCQALQEKRGFIIKQMAEDGACMFRAVADQVYGDQEMHPTVRRHCVDYMAKNADFFCHYVTEDFDTYLNRKRIDSSHGNHVEIQALSELFNRAIEVYQYSLEPINTFHGAYKTDNEPIRLSYHKGVHYNSIVDPKKASVGVGLGLPGFQPGLADKNLMSDAVRASEKVAIEKTMLDDKMRETDWEVTQESIEEQVAQESYLQWLRDQEKLAKRPSSSSPRTGSATCSSASESQAWWEGTTSSNSQEPRSSRSPRNRSNNASAQNSPNRPSEGAMQDPLPSPKPLEIIQLNLPGGPRSPNSPQPSTTKGEYESCGPRLEGAVGGFQETVSMMNDIVPQMYGLSEWDEDDILAQVIAQSQQEYLEDLKKKAHTASSSSSSTPMGGVSPNRGYSDDDDAIDMDTHERSHMSKNSHSNSKGSSAKKS